MLDDKMSDDHRTPSGSKEDDTGVSKTQAVLIVFSILVTMALYVGIWNSKLAAQERELARVAEENRLLALRLQEAQGRIRSLSSELGAASQARDAGSSLSGGRGS